MKFLFRSAAGDSMSIARRVEAEGNEVRLWIAKPSMRHVGDGMVTKTNDIAAVEWADVIVFDSHGHGLAAEAEKWRASKPVLGSSAFADKLEHDRNMGIELAEAVGISVPEYAEFSGHRAFDEAADYIVEHEKSNNAGWVLKPNTDEIRTHIALDSEEMLRMLEFFACRFTQEKVAPDFVLQWRLKGIEVSTEAWFNGESWGLPNGTIEEQRFFDGDLGELTGCAGNIVWAYEDLDAPLVKKLLLPLTPHLKGKYRGPVDVNSLVTPDGDPCFLEFSPRFGYSAIFALLELVDDAGRLFWEVANGKPITTKVQTDRFAIGIRATIPPYPVGGDAATGYPVLGFDPETVDKHLSPGDLCVVDDEVETTGDSGVAFEFTQSDVTIPEAATKLYETARSVRVPNMRYRTDIGVTAKEDYDKLTALGLILRRDKLPWF